MGNCGCCKFHVTTGTLLLKGDICHGFVMKCDACGIRNLYLFVTKDICAECLRDYQGFCLNVTIGLERKDNVNIIVVWLFTAFSIYSISND